MTKPKKIEILFFLVFLFLGISMFPQKDSLKIKFKQTPLVFKYGVNYLMQENNFFYNGSYSNSYNGSGYSISAYPQHFLDAFGPYIGFGKVSKNSQYFSVYTGISYTHTRFEFKYGRSELTKIDTPNFYTRKIFLAEGYIFRNILTAEINFHIDIKKSRIILSPINPSFVFSNYMVQKKHTEEYNSIITNGGYGTHEVIISEIKTGQEDFDMKYPGPSLRFLSPIFIGFEQRIILKKRVVMIGIKGTILIVRNDDDSYGGQLYTGFEF